LDNSQKYLVDTNIWLESLLRQERANISDSFLINISTTRLFMSDFSLFSIGIILDRYNKIDTFDEFIEDVFNSGSLTLLSLTPNEILSVSQTIISTNLDFDDAYQVAVAEKYNIKIVTFDRDFSRANIEAVSPEALI
jgi:predicted nucleic acid-binding protein